MHLYFVIVCWQDFLNIFQADHPPCACGNVLFPVLFINWFVCFILNCDEFSTIITCINAGIKLYNMPLYMVTWFGNKLLQN